MESQIIIGILIVGFVTLFFLVNKKSAKKQDATLIEWLKSMQISLDKTNRTLNEVLKDTNTNLNQTLQSNTAEINKRLDNATKVISDVQKNIGEMSEIGRSMQDLQEFLRSPKLRGNIGEQVLKELLGQMLPKQSFNLQYHFKNGAIVDAAIKTEAGIIPIDSKFPMENFRKLGGAENIKAQKDFESDVKKHVDSISKKYILTNEGTIDYALMYVPSESVYYEIINNSTIFDYCSTQRVLPVSPSTFYAYLKAILMGFEGQKISKKAHEILAGLRAINKEHEKLGESLDTLSKHINNSYNVISQVNMGYSKLGQQIKVTGSMEAEEKLLD